MIYELNDHQCEAVQKLNGPKRFNHFISRGADWEEVWSLRNNEGFVAFADDESNECIPFWPHPKYAEILATKTWVDCVPQKIELDAYLNQWLPGMASDKLMAAVFPTPNSKAIVIDPLKLKEEIEAELKQYE